MYKPVKQKKLNLSLIYVNHEMFNVTEGMTMIKKIYCVFDKVYVSLWFQLYVM